MANRSTRNGSAAAAERSTQGRRHQDRTAEHASGDQPRKGSTRPEADEKSRPESHGNGGRGSAAKRSNGAAGYRKARSGRSAQAGSRRRAGGREAGVGSGLIETVREHPVPTALVGAGVAWLLYEGVRRRYPEAVYERTKDALETVGEGFSSIGDKVSEAAASTGESFHEQFEESAAASRERTARLGQSVKAGAARLGEMVRDGASAAGHAIEHGYDSGRGALADLWQSHPLACGVGVMALGVAAGLMLPATQAERRAAGERSRRLLERAGNAGRGLLNQGKEIAGRVLNKGASTVADEAEREGLTPDRLAKKVRRIARRVGEAVSDAAEDE